MTDPYFILELTTRCNLDCLYCYNIWKGKDHFSHQDISIKKVEQIFEEITGSTSVRGVTLAGGEPLLNRDLFSIASYLRDKRVKLSITSNGTLLTEDIVKKLVDCGVSHFEISLPSSDNKSFKTLCNSDEYRAVRTAILNVKKLGAKLSVSCVITRLNFNEVYDIVQLSAVFGADFFVLNRFIPGGKGSLNNELLKPEIPELVFALSEVNRCSSDYKIPVIAAIPIEHCMIDTSAYRNINFGTCVCGDAKWVIDPAGRLRICEQNPEILGTLPNDNFENLVNDEAVSRFRNLDFHSDCKIKSCYAMCGGGCRFNLQ
jgi:radical SAM protein with 4Fe4S-binding SPASM domain